MTTQQADRAGIYVRISDDRAEGAGVRRQEEDGRKLAESLGWDVVDVYSDNDISAFTGKDRPAYRSLLEDLAAGRINCVVAWAPDRLHRSPRELEDFVDLADRRHVITHTVQSGAWDLSTPSGRAVARTLGAWSRYESEHKGQRVRRANAQRATEGRWEGNRKVYGWTPGGREVVPEEAGVIRMATERLLAGVSLRAIVTDLNASGLHTITGRPWNSKILTDALRRPRNAALAVHHGEIIGPGQWPAIVSEEEHRAVVALLSDDSRRTAPMGGEVRWLGSGLYRCGICGRPTMRVTSTTGGTGQPPRRAYRCVDVSGGTE
ncbi:MAG: recombinase family protein, partial [Anaerolineae bacterium]